MKRVVIPSKGCSTWAEELFEAVQKADDQTVIVVNNEGKRIIAERRARQLGKEIEVEIGVE